MGDATSRNGAMKPAHDVEVSSYYMSEHEVTKELWYKVHDWAITRPDGGEIYEFAFDLLTANGRNRPHVDPSYKDDFPITSANWRRFG